MSGYSNAATRCRRSHLSDIRLRYNYTTGNWQIQGHRCDRNVPKCDVVVTSTIISCANEKAWMGWSRFCVDFWRFQGVKSYSKRSEKGGLEHKKRTAQEKRRPKQNGAKKARNIKRNETPNMPTSEELWGDSPSGLAANAPFRSALSWPFYPSFSELFGGCLTAPRSGALV